MLKQFEGLQIAVIDVLIKGNSVLAGWFAKVQIFDRRIATGIGT
jgi:hypothetical protein